MSALAEAEKKNLDRWSAEPARGSDGLWLIRYSPNPGGTKREDGTTAHTLSFPALMLSEFVGAQEDTAKAIARELNCHDELLAACLTALGAMTGNMDGDWIGQDPVADLRKAISKANGEAT